MAAAESTPRPRSSVLAALREATSGAHEELDRRLGIHAETMTRDGYVRFLRASGAVVAPLEAAIACWLGFSPDGVTRLSAVRSDLFALGMTEPPPTAPVPDIRSVAEAMGAAYVVEGSALGGAVLARTVATALGPEIPRRYLSLRGDRTGDRWRDFVNALETWGGNATPSARVIACDTARATFAAYAASFAAAGALAAT